MTGGATTPHGRSISHRRPWFCIPLPGGETLELGRRTAVMGIVNVTPDSFSDGGAQLDPEAAIDAGLRMAEDGATLIDVGGESTRPGATVIEADLESHRIVPVIEALARRLPDGVHVSVDTMKASVAARAIDAGARLVNDVTGAGDPDMLPTVIERDAAIVLMHMRGSPRTMQRRTDYPDGLIETLLGWFEDRLASATRAGLPDGRIVLDPGIGFGKSVEGNLEILRRLDELADLGRPLLIGASRKSFIGSILGATVDERLEGGLAAAVLAVERGAHIVRTHDVGPTVRALRLLDAAIHDGDERQRGDDRMSGT